MLLFQLFIRRRLNVPYFESYSSYLDDIALRESVTFNAFVGIIGVLYDFPEHTFGILEEVFISD